MTVLKVPWRSRLRGYVVRHILYTVYRVFKKIYIYFDERQFTISYYSSGQFLFVKFISNLFTSR